MFNLGRLPLIARFQSKLEVGLDVVAFGGKLFPWVKTEPECFKFGKCFFRCLGVVPEIFAGTDSLQRGYFLCKTGALKAASE